MDKRIGAGTSNFSCGAEYQAQSSAGSITGNLTLSSAGQWAGSMMVAQPAAAVSGGGGIGGNAGIGGKAGIG